VDGHDAAPERGENAQVRGPERRAGLEHSLARLDVLARVADVLPRLGDHQHAEPVALPLRVLLAHHRVGSRRDRRAGEHSHRLAAAQDRLGRAARSHLEGDAQLDRAIRRGPGRVLPAQRVAVHRGVVRWREAPIRDDGPCQNPAQGLACSHGLQAQDRRLLQDQPQGLRRREPASHTPTVPALTARR
jgi:hypothetical protein